MRLDALIKLKMEDLKTVELEDFTIYQITVYAGFNEEYITFCTPECYELLQIYFNERQKYGEKFKPTTPIIRNLFHTVNASPLSILHPRFLTSKAIQDLLMNKLQQSGIRNVEHSETKYQSSLRKSVPLVHGFRKFFNTCLMNSDVNYVFKELLMGHSVKLDNVYYDKNSEKSRLKLLEEYAKAIDALTIYEENRLKKQVKELTVKKAEMDRMRLELDELYHMIKGS